MHAKKRLRVTSVAALVENYWYLKEALSAPMSTLGVIPDLQTGALPQSSHPYYNHEENMCRLCDAGLPFKGLSNDEVEALRLRYWCKYGYESTMVREDGKAGKTVLVENRKPLTPSYARCAKKMGFNHPQTFRRLISRAQNKVSENIYKKVCLSTSLPVVA